MVPLSAVVQVGRVVLEETRLRRLDGEIAGNYAD